MAWPLIVMYPRRRLTAPVAEVANVLRMAGCDPRLRVFCRATAAAGGRGSR
jgi:hypothetical protein